MSRTATREPERAVRSSSYSVLHLTTSRNAHFYRTQMDSLDRRGVDYEILEVPGESVGKKAGVNRTPVDYLRFFPVVRRAITGGEFDLVHANYGLTAPHALAQSRLPVVLSLWGSDVNGPFGWVSKLTAPRCEAVVVMSAQLGEQLPSEYTVLPHGIDLEQFSPMPQSAAREALGWERDAHHVLFPAPIAREEKDFPRARRVVRAARGDLSKPLVLQTPNMDVPHDRMPVWMNAADALLITSRHEGLPNAVKEALACNLPVVSTDVGSIRERLEPVSLSTVGTTDAELVDALVDTLRDGGRSDGREAVTDLDVDRVAERLEGVYERVLDGEET